MKSLEIETELCAVIGKSEIRQLAVEAGFCKRNGGKITPLSFLCVFCVKAIDGGCSIGNYAVSLAFALSQGISRQAVWKRINAEAVAFLFAALQVLIGEKLALHRVVAKDLLKFFPRILIQDSTVVALHKTLFEHFKGSSNQNGQSSSLKIQAVYDVISNAFIHFDLTSFRENDQSASSNLVFLRQGDLLIRDLGYFAIDSFVAIARMKAFFLSRLKYGVGVFDVNTAKPINLLKILRGKEHVDINVLLGDKQKLPVRLIGEKLPSKVAAKRRREYKQNRDKKLNPSKKHLTLLGWNLFITNIPEETWKAKTIILAYSIRWRIEIIFKSWKSCLNFDLKRKCSADQITLLVYCRLIIVTLLTSYYYQRFDVLVKRKSGRRLSLLRFFDLFSENSRSMLEYFQTRNTRKKKLLLDILIKSATYDERKDRLSYAQCVEMLGRNPHSFSIKAKEDPSLLSQINNTN